MAGPQMYSKANDSLAGRFRLAMAECTVRAELPRSGARAGRSGVVKGFRMPASHGARGCTEAGVRKASKEETAGGECAGGSVGLWGFKPRFCVTWLLWDGTAGLNGERGR